MALTLIRARAPARPAYSRERRCILRAIKYREMARMAHHMKPAEYKRNLTEALDSGDLKPEDFDFAEMTEAFLGREFQQLCKPGEENCHATDAIRVMEAGDAVDYTAFQTITQRVISTKVVEEFNLESDKAAAMVDLEPNVRLRNERRPGITALENEGEVVHPGMPYPRQGLSEKYQDFGDAEKRGTIVPITKEALFFVGLSGDILRQAGGVGTVLGRNKDKRIWNVFLGIATAGNFTYGMKGLAPVVYNTYNNAAVADAAGNVIVPQNIHGFALNSWHDIDRANRLFDAMVDPDTAEPIEIRETNIYVMPAAMMAAQSIITATEKRVTQGADTRIFSNPVAGYNVTDMGRRARALAAATFDFGNVDGMWFLGDPKKAFVYRENWPLTVVQAPLNATDEFERDIVFQIKSSERGSCWVKRPHYMLVSSSSCGHSSSGETVCTPDAWPAGDADAPH